MLQHKRISKPANTSSFSTRPGNNKQKVPKKNKKLNRCTYRFLPISGKSAHSNKIHTLYGDVVVSEVDNGLVFEPSLLNWGVKYEEVKIIKNSNQKFLNIKATRVKGQKVLVWSQLVKRLKGLKSDDWSEWADLIQVFSETYETVFNVGDASKDGIKVEISESQVESEQKFTKQKDSLMANYPCLVINSAIEDGDYTVNELIFNEEFIKELGYTLDLFSTAVLEDGIPTLFHKGHEGRVVAVKAFLKMFFTLKEESYKTQEHSSFLVTKNGEIREIIFQVHYFPSATGGKGGVDTLIAILKIGAPRQVDEPISQNRVNKTYRQSAQLKESEIKQFLSLYYAASISPQAANPDKVCRIRELTYPPDEDIYGRPKIIKLESFHS